MFQKILAWVKEVIKKMFGANTLKTALSVDVAVSSEMAEALELWRRMYINDSPWLNSDTKSLNLAAAIAGEVARAVTIESDVEMSGGPRADYLYGQFDPLFDGIRPRLEYGMAIGGVVFKPYVNGDRVSVDFVYADQFYPISFDDSGRIVDCVFADTKTITNAYYTRLERHRLTPEGAEITNLAYRSTSKNDLGQPVPLESVEAWASILPSAVITGVDRLLVGYYKPPIANNIDLASPLGVSVYARAVELIEQADKQWSDLLWEFDSGKRSLYVDELAFGRDANNKPILPNKRLYRTLKSGSPDGDMFKEWTPTLREQNIINGLDAILRKIEFTVGLAYGTISNPESVALTATEIVASKQRTAALVKDNQKALEDALEDLLYAMDVYATVYGLAPAGTYQVVFTWDDSVVTDSNTQFAQDLQALSAGVMSKARFMERNYGMTPEMAQKELLAINAERPADLFNPADLLNGNANI